MGQEAQDLLSLLLWRGDCHPARDELHKVWCTCMHWCSACLPVSYLLFNKFNRNSLKLVVHVIRVMWSELVS